MVLILLTACNSSPIVFEANFVISGSEKILVLPFKDLTKEYGEEEVLKCPASGSVFVAGKVMEGAENILTENLVFYLKNNTRFEVVTSNQVMEVRSAPVFEKRPFFSELDFLVKEGRQAKADLLLFGYIYRFRQRVGTRYAVQNSASVALSLHMIKVADGSSIWYAHFDETQQSLSENLFLLKTFFQRKARWVTAEELAISGLEKMLKTLPIQ